MLCDIPFARKSDVKTEKKQSNRLFLAILPILADANQCHFKTAGPIEPNSFAKDGAGFLALKPAIGRCPVMLGSPTLAMLALRWHYVGGPRLCGAVALDLLVVSLCSDDEQILLNSGCQVDVSLSLSDVKRRR